MFWFLKKIPLFKRHFSTLNHIYISQKNLENNIKIFQDLDPEMMIFPVLKSNAYGHGIEQIATCLKKYDFPYLAVDSYFEALKIQKVYHKKVLLIWYTLPQNLKYINFKKISLVVYDTATLQELKNIWKKIHIHLKIDTGMNRQGILPWELHSFLESIASSPNLILEWVCSHFYDADSTDNTHSQKQLTIFAECKKKILEKWFSPKYFHINNSAWALKSLWNPHTNAIRLGIGMYGINPLSPNDPLYHTLSRLKPILSFVSTLILKKHISTWETISYNATFSAPHDMEIGIIPVWYYEWLPRSISNNFWVYFWNTKLPILGRICMNLCVIDISSVEIEIWSQIEIIWTQKQKENTLSHLALIAETIPYEIAVKLSESIRRDIIFEK